MPFTVRFDPENFCVLTKVVGDLNFEVVGEILAEIGRVAAAHRCGRTLSDLREARIAGDAVDIYESVRQLQKSNVLRTFRRALVVARDHADYHFWETACRNQGFHSVRVFDSMEEAKAWILDQPREDGVIPEKPRPPGAPASDPLD